jgi:hypothetical protein
MNQRRRTILIVLAALLALTRTGSADAQETHPFDEYGILDTISIDVRASGQGHWIATIVLQNDENIAAMTLPLQWRPHGERFRLDSASYVGLRTEYFALKTFYPDTVEGTILIGLISDLGNGLPPLEPGRGAIARLHFTALSDSAESLAVDTTFIRPHNVLQMVTPDVRSVLPAFERRQPKR